MPVFVPQVAGVPPVAFDPAAQAAATLLLADAYRAVGGLFGQQWGLFLNGQAVVMADNVLDISYRQDWNISDYPLEKGAFESYNKVQIPRDIRLRFSAGGSESDRAALLNSIDAIAGDLRLYDAVTPEATYSNLNIHHYDYRRTAINGVGLITIDVWCEEVRVISGSGPFMNTASPSATANVNGGTVQTTTPTGAQAASVWT